MVENTNITAVNLQDALNQEDEEGNVVSDSTENIRVIPQREFAHQLTRNHTMTQHAYQKHLMEEKDIDFRSKYYEVVQER